MRQTAIRHKKTLISEELVVFRSLEDEIFNMNFFLTTIVIKYQSSLKQFFESEKAYLLAVKCIFFCCIKKVLFSNTINFYRS